MREVIKEPLDVGVEYVCVPEPMELLQPPHRVMAASPRPKAEGVVVKDFFEQRTQARAGCEETRIARSSGIGLPRDGSSRDFWTGTDPPR